MKPDQFWVSEHHSYDIIGNIFYAMCQDPRKNLASMNRMQWCTIMMASPTRCRCRLFPDYQFNQKEYARIKDEA